MGTSILQARVGSGSSSMVRQGGQLPCVPLWLHLVGVMLVAQLAAATTFGTATSHGGDYSGATDTASVAPYAPAAAADAAPKRGRILRQEEPPTAGTPSSHGRQHGADGRAGPETLLQNDAASSQNEDAEDDAEEGEDENEEGLEAPNDGAMGVGGGNQMLMDQMPYWQAAPQAWQEIPPWMQPPPQGMPQWAPPAVPAQQQPYMPPPGWFAQPPQQPGWPPAYNSGAQNWAAAQQQPQQFPQLQPMQAAQQQQPYPAQWVASAPQQQQPGNGQPPMPIAAQASAPVNSPAQAMDQPANQASNPPATDPSAKTPPAMDPPPVSNDGSTMEQHFREAATKVQPQPSVPDSKIQQKSDQDSHATPQHQKQSASTEKNETNQHRGSRHLTSPLPVTPKVSLKKLGRKGDWQVPPPHLGILVEEELTDPHETNEDVEEQPKHPIHRVHHSKRAVSEGDMAGTDVDGQTHPKRLKVASAASETETSVKSLSRSTSSRKKDETSKSKPDLKTDSHLIRREVRQHSRHHPAPRHAGHHAEAHAKSSKEADLVKKHEEAVKDTEKDTKKETKKSTKKRHEEAKKGTKTGTKKPDEEVHASRKQTSHPRPRKMHSSTEPHHVKKARSRPRPRPADVAAEVETKQNPIPQHIVGEKIISANHAEALEKLKAARQKAQFDQMLLTMHPLPAPFTPGCLVMMVNGCSDKPDSPLKPGQWVTVNDPDLEQKDSYAEKLRYCEGELLQKYFSECGSTDGTALYKVSEAMKNNMTATVPTASYGVSDYVSAVRFYEMTAMDSYGTDETDKLKCSVWQDIGAKDCANPFEFVGISFDECTYKCNKYENCKGISFKQATHTGQPDDITKCILLGRLPTMTGTACVCSTESGQACPCGYNEYKKLPLVNGTADVPASHHRAAIVLGYEPVKTPALAEDGNISGNVSNTGDYTVDEQSLAYVVDGCFKGNLASAKDFEAQLQNIEFKAAVRCCSQDGSACQSQLPTCHTLKTRTEASDICSQHAMRLCTKDELESKVCCDAGGGGNPSPQGCGFDDHLVWSSSDPGPFPDNWRGLVSELIANFEQEGILGLSKTDIMVALWNSYFDAGKTQPDLQVAKQALYELHSTRGLVIMPDLPNATNSGPNYCVETCQGPQWETTCSRVECIACPECAAYKVGFDNETACCEAATSSCNACKMDLAEDEYCSKFPHVTGCSKFFIEVSTASTKEIPANAVDIPLADVSGLHPGDFIIIGSGDFAETKKITQIILSPKPKTDNQTNTTTPTTPTNQSTSGNSSGTNGSTAVLQQERSAIAKPKHHKKSGAKRKKSTASRSLLDLDMEGDNDADPSPGIVVIDSPVMNTHAAGVQVTSRNPATLPVALCPKDGKRMTLSFKLMVFNGFCASMEVEMGPGRDHGSFCWESEPNNTRELSSIAIGKAESGPYAIGAVVRYAGGNPFEVVAQDATRGYLDCSAAHMADQSCAKLVQTLGLRNDGITREVEVEYCPPRITGGAPKEDNSTSNVEFDMVVNNVAYDKLSRSPILQQTLAMAIKQAVSATFDPADFQIRTVEIELVEYQPASSSSLLSINTSSSGSSSLLTSSASKSGVGDDLDSILLKAHRADPTPQAPAPTPPVVAPAPPSVPDSEGVRVHVRIVPTVHSNLTKMAERVSHVQTSGLLSKLVMKTIKAVPGIHTISKGLLRLSKMTVPKILARADSTRRRRSIATGGQRRRRRVSVSNIPETATAFKLGSASDLNPRTAVVMAEE